MIFLDLNNLSDLSWFKTELNLEKIYDYLIQQNCLLMIENFSRKEKTKFLVLKENCLYLQPVRKEVSLK